jgi:WD40 repeat protein
MALSSDAVIALAFDARGDELAAADGSRITLWRIGGVGLQSSTALDLPALDDLVMVGPRAFVAGGNGRLERAGGDKPALAIASSPTGLITLGASPDGRVLVAGGTGSRTVVAWRRGGGSAFRPSGDAFRRPADIPTAVAVTSGGTVVAEATQRGTIDLWRLGSRSTTPVVVRTGRSPLTALAAAPAGAQLAAGARDGSVWLVRTDRPGATRALTLAGVRVVDLALAPDGRTIAAAGSDGAVSLIRGAKVVRTLRAGPAALTAVTFDPEGETVAAGDENGHVYLWRARDGLAAGPPLASPRKIVALSFDPTGNRLAVGLEDGSVDVLDRAYWDEAEAMSSLCSRLGGSLTAAELAAYLPGGRGGGACR